ncbi:MAG: hypothetical protein K8S54_02560 [Spirochaetia bacterium]|nr:hypothetical protein [Spirochaetia bacterium]
MSQVLMRRILALGVFTLSQGMLFTQPPPTEAACRDMYLKRVEALAGSTDPIAPGLELKKTELLKEDAVQAAVSHCLMYDSAQYVECARNSKDPQEECKRESIDPDKAEPDKTSEKSEKSEPEIKPDRLATGEECSKAYEHLLALYSTPELKKKPGGEKLVQNWKSDVSRKSFQTRCTTAFHSQDIQCIVSSNDVDYVRACLLVIPE